MIFCHDKMVATELSDEVPNDKMTSFSPKIMFRFDTLMILQSTATSGLYKDGVICPLFDTGRQYVRHESDKKSYFYLKCRYPKAWGVKSSRSPGPGFWPYYKFFPVYHFNLRLSILKLEDKLVMLKVGCDDRRLVHQNSNIKSWFISRFARIIFITFQHR